MKSLAKSPRGTQTTSDVELQFIAAALAKVQNPEHRYWLTIGFEAVANALSLVERTPRASALQQRKAKGDRKTGRL